MEPSGVDKVVKATIVLHNYIQMQHTRTINS